MKTADNTNAGDVFNARDLSPEEVATSFIVSPAFNRLLGVSHCVLEGPRGSGKTTLLRMLTPEAFALWSQDKPERMIPFIGIFVPADVRWAKQLNARLSRVTDTLIRETVHQAIFSVAVNLAFIETLEECSSLAGIYTQKHPNLFFELSREAQAAIVHRLSELWHLNVPVPSFNGVKLALTKRQLELGAVALRLASGANLNEILTDYGYIAITWLDNIINAVECANEVLGKPDQKWAVLLDELEIVPPELLASIVPALRSTCRHLRFKLALSPTGIDLISSSDSAQPTDDNDYRSIRLWYDKKDEARHFADRLFLSALEWRVGVQKGASLLQILQPSSITDEGDDSEDSVQQDGVKDAVAHRERIAAFVRLYGRDDSFKAVLDARGIDPKDPPISDSDPNGSWVRKITPLARHRSQEIDRFESAIGKSKRRGGPKGMQPYLGYPNLIDLTEGNPRWVLTLAEAVIAHSEESGHTLSAQGVQGQAVRTYVESYVAKLKVYPTGLPNTFRRWTSFQFISALGEAIAASLYDGPFNSDPSMSFIVDSRALQQYGVYIRTCIDLGALVLIKKNGAAPMAGQSEHAGLEGARVRLSYRLAPRFRLPFRSTKEQTISSALKAGDLLHQEEDRSFADREKKLVADKLPIQPKLL